jgi:mevalonate kinase
MSKQLFRGNGKLLLTGEYLVLQGAESMALPTKLGQTMEVKETSGAEIKWLSLDRNGEKWFEAKLSQYDFKAIDTSDEQVSGLLTKLFKACARQDSEFLAQWGGRQVTTQLEFERSWGLGSSSTLIHCIAAWADVNAYQLCMDTIGGSAYDVACAAADGPIIYQLDDNRISIQEADFMPKFHEHIYLAFLGKKQDSQKAVADFQRSKKDFKSEISDVSAITHEIEKGIALEKFIELMNAHESIIGKVLDQPTIKDERFNDFEGAVKSLGAWGGDFALFVSNMDPKNIVSYLDKKGLNTYFKYQDLILNR